MILELVFIALAIILLIFFLVWVFFTRPRAGSRPGGISMLAWDSMLIILGIMVIATGMLIRSRHIESNMAEKKEAIKSWMAEQGVKEIMEEEDAAGAEDGR